MGELEHLASRGYTEGFYRRHIPSEYQNYEQGNSGNTSRQFVAEVIDCDGGWLTLEVKNRFEVGDKLELITPRGNLRFNLEVLEDLRGRAVGSVPGSGHTVRTPLPAGVALAGDDGFALLMRYLK